MAERKLLKWFEERTYYTGGDFDDDKKLFGDLKDLIGDVCNEASDPGEFFYYLATPPDLFANVTQKIVKNGLGKEENGNWRRFIFEKPFGRDLESAKKLNADLLKHLQGTADLSHRPLPRQRNGAEHFGLPFRQQHF